MARGFLRSEPVVPFAGPARLSYYRQTVAALGLGIVFAIGTFFANRTLRPAWFRWLSIVLASLGVVVSAYLLWTLIGTCGLGVIGGTCNP